VPFADRVPRSADRVGAADGSIKPGSHAGHDREVRREVDRCRPRCPAARKFRPCANEGCPVTASARRSLDGEILLPGQLEV
jgi:hypothetical protein